MLNNFNPPKNPPKGISMFRSNIIRLLETENMSEDDLKQEMHKVIHQELEKEEPFAHKAKIYPFTTMKLVH